MEEGMKEYTVQFLYNQDAEKNDMNDDMKSPEGV